MERLKGMRNNVEFKNHGVRKGRLLYAMSTSADLERPTPVKGHRTPLQISPW